MPRQYNAARLYLEGGEDGKVKVNFQAGLVWLETLQKTGSINVDAKIEEVVNYLDVLQRERRQRIKEKNAAAFNNTEPKK